MQILSNGYQKPETGDFGSEFFPALEQNIQLMNDHNHNGTNGEKISALFVEAAPVVAVTAASFTDQGNGYHRALAVVPGGQQADNFMPLMRDPVTKEQIFGRVEKNSATSFFVYLNYVQDVEVYFGV